MRPGRLQRPLDARTVGAAAAEAGIRRGGVRLWLAAIAAVAVVGCELVDPNPGPHAFDGAGSSFVDTSAPTVPKGAELYAANCDRCHGADGVGTLIWPAPIWRFGQSGQIIRDGQGAMPAFPSLSDSQLVSIDLYLASIGPDPTTLPEENFTNFCEGCHGAFGAGGPFFPSSIQGYGPILDLVRQGRGEMPAVGVERLGPAALDSLEEFLATLTDLGAYSGEEYYVARCAGCHGFTGEGTERGYQLRLPSRGYASYVIREGRPGVQFPNTMPAYTTDHLTEQQLTELLDFLDGFDRPTTGHDLFSTFCANCHGIDARGGPAGSDLSGTLDPQEFLGSVRSGFAGNRYWNRIGYMPRWTESELSDAEVTEIQAYLDQL